MNLKAKLILAFFVYFIFNYGKKMFTNCKTKVTNKKKYKKILIQTTTYESLGNTTVYNIVQK